MPLLHHGEKSLKKMIQLQRTGSGQLSQEHIPEEAAFELSSDEFSRVGEMYRKHRRASRPAEKGMCKGPVEQGRVMSEMDMWKRGMRRMCLGPGTDYEGLRPGISSPFSEGPDRKD